MFTHTRGRVCVSDDDDEEEQQDSQLQIHIFIDFKNFGRNKRQSFLHNKFIKKYIIQ